MAACMRASVFLRQSTTNWYVSEQRKPTLEMAPGVRTPRYTEYITIFRLDILFIFGKWMSDETYTMP